MESLSWRDEMFVRNIRLMLRQVRRKALQIDGPQETQYPFRHVRLLPGVGDTLDDTPNDTPNNNSM